MRCFGVCKQPTMIRTTQIGKVMGSNGRDTERDIERKGYFVCGFVLELTSQGGLYQVYLVTALLHITIIRKESKNLLKNQRKDGGCWRPRNRPRSGRNMKLWYHVTTIVHGAVVVNNIAPLLGRCGGRKNNNGRSVTTDRHGFVVKTIEAVAS